MFGTISYRYDRTCGATVFFLDVAGSQVLSNLFLGRTVNDARRALAELNTGRIRRGFAPIKVNHHLIFEAATPAAPHVPGDYLNKGPLTTQTTPPADRKFAQAVFPF